MSPFDIDPLDERYRWCIYCKADCWPEEENQQHKDDCPIVTGLYPVDQEMVDMGARCGGGETGNECKYVFKLGDFYMYTEVEQLNDRDKMVVVGCIACALSEHMEQRGESA